MNQFNALVPRNYGLGLNSCFIGCRVRMRCYKNTFVTYGAIGLTGVNITSRAHPCCADTGVFHMNTGTAGHNIARDSYLGVLARGVRLHDIDAPPAVSCSLARGNAVSVYIERGLIACPDVSRHLNGSRPRLVLKDINPVLSDRIAGPRCAYVASDSDVCIRILCMGGVNTANLHAAAMLR